MDKLLEYKRNWIQHVNGMPRNRLPRVMKHNSPTGRRNHCRPLKRLLDTWDRNGPTSGPTAWQIWDDDDDDDDDDDSHCINWMYIIQKRTVPGSIPGGVTGFFSDVSFRPHHGPGVDSAPSENEYQEHFLAVKAAGAWGWPHHLHVPNVMKIWEPKPPGTLWATPGLLRDCFTFTFYKSTINKIPTSEIFVYTVASCMFRLLIWPSSGRRYKKYKVSRWYHFLSVRASPRHQLTVMKIIV